MTKVTDIARRTLKNAISHTDTHNRIVEEAAMWSWYNRYNNVDVARTKRGHLSSRRELDAAQSDKTRSLPPETRGVSVAGVKRTAHMDDYPTHVSTRYTRQLQKMEEADVDRWAHSGYKEMYPEDFMSDRSRSSSPAEQQHLTIRMPQHGPRHECNSRSSVGQQRMDASRRGYVSSDDESANLMKKHGHKRVATDVGDYEKIRKTSCGNCQETAAGERRSAHGACTCYELRDSHVKTDVSCMKERVKHRSKKSKHKRKITVQTLGDLNHRVNGDSHKKKARGDREKGRHNKRKCKKSRHKRDECHP